MKIAVSATAPRLDANVDPRFGRCQYVLIVDTETMEWRAIENPAMNAPGGAGVRTAGLVVGEGAQAVITGECGPRAYEVLSAAGVPVFVGASGTVRDAVEAYNSGAVSSIGAASTGPGRGMGGRPGMGGGRR